MNNLGFLAQGVFLPNPIDNSAEEIETKKLILNAISTPSITSATAQSVDYFDSATKRRKVVAFDGVSTTTDEEILTDSTGLQLTGGTMSGAIGALRTNDTSIFLGNGVDDTAGANSINIGNFTGSGASNVVNIGEQAGDNGQDQYSVAIGYRAGSTNQANNAVSLGFYAGNSGQGATAIAIGASAGENNQTKESIAIGEFAGRTDQAQCAIAIGRGAGNNTQATGAVSIGDSAGKTSQENSAVAIGLFAGEITQGQNSVAIGRFAAQENQGQSSVAIGRNAGGIDQGDYAIAIGRYAGQTNQHGSSILINASPLAVNSTQANEIRIKAGSSLLVMDPLRIISTVGEFVPLDGSFRVQGGLYAGAANRPALTGGFSQIQSVTVANTAVETSLVGTGVGSLVTGANVLKVGSTSRVIANGTINTAGNGENLTLRLKINGAPLLSFATSAANTLSVDSGWTLKSTWVVKSIVGTVATIGISSQLSAGNTNNEAFIRTTSDTVTMDPTIASAFDLSVEWSAADPDNEITCDGLVTTNLYQPL